MARFVRTAEDRWLNLDMVESISAWKDRDGNDRWTAISPSGDEWKLALGFDPETELPEIIPSHGLVATVVQADALHREVWTDERPIIGWRVLRDCPEPIFPEGAPASGIMWAIQTPDGEWFCPYIGFFETLDLLKKHCLDAEIQAADVRAVVKQSKVTG